MGSPGDEGKGAERGRSTAGQFLDHRAEPEFFVGGEERRRGAEVHLGGIDDLAVPARLLDQVNVGLRSPAAEAELHIRRNTPNIINTSL